MKYIYILETFLIFILFLVKDIKIRKNQSDIFMDRYHTSQMRGIAIIIIIISHLGGVYGTRIFTPLGGIGVSIFLIISGYGLSKSYQSKGLKKFWYNKILKVLIPYYIVSFIYLIFNPKSSLKDIFLDVTLIKPLHPFGWYMNYILVMYIIFYLVQSINAKQRIRNIIYILNALVMIFIMPEIKAEQSFSFFVGVIYAFNSEVIHSKLFKNSKISILIGFILVSVSALILKQFSIIRNSHDVILNFIQLVIKLFGALSLIGLAYSSRRLIGKLNLSLISKISFELYLVHGYTIILLKNISVFNILIFFVITIILAVMLHKVNNFVINKLNSVYNC